MKLEPLQLDGAYLVRLEPRGDTRGHLERLFCRDTFAELGLADCRRQVSHVVNASRLTLRGLHFQRAPHAETKLIWICDGVLFDVLADLRPQSPTYGRWQGLEVHAGEPVMIYAPAGLAHGYLTLSERSAMVYFIDTPYAAHAAAGVRWDDPQLAIDWPAAPEVISERDLTLPSLAELKP